MIRRPPRSTQSRSSAASDVYKRQELEGLEGRRRNVVAGMLAVEKYEVPMASYLRAELRKLAGITVYGPAEGQPRTSTVVFTVDGEKPADVCKILGCLLYTS